MKIANNIIKEHLKNVYFLCGGAYGGKTTMAKLLEEKYGFIRYRQGDHWDEYAAKLIPKNIPIFVQSNSDKKWFKDKVLKM